MNLHYLIRKLIGRPTCILGNKSRLLSSARILNAGLSSKLISIGANTIISGELFVSAHGGRIVVGDWCFVGPGSRLWSAGQIRIGHRVLISHNVNIFDSLTHPINPSQRHNHFKKIATTGHPSELDLQEDPVEISNDAWIGASSTVLRGVKIGEGSIVGAGSVVTHDVPNFTIVAGNPAMVIRELRAEERT